MKPQARGLAAPALPGEPGRAPAAATGTLPGMESWPPSGGSEAQDLFRRIGEHMRRAEKLLLQPSAHNAARLVAELEQCCHLLAVAGPLWRAAAIAEPAPPDELPWRSLLQRLETLTAGASAFCQGWAAAAGLAAGYTSSGANWPAGAGGATLNQTG
jgi:hypothetical protein